MMSSFPHPLAGLSAIAIAAGAYHTCAILTGGGVKCWGANYYGQLGIGSYTRRSRPADVTGAARSRRARERKEGSWANG
jgi:alpha-tubulin suppressor-like RCC1 family protein